MSPPLEFSGPLQRAPGHVLGEPWDYSRNALRVLLITPGALWEHFTVFPNLTISSHFYADKRIDYNTENRYICTKCSQHNEKNDNTSHSNQYLKEFGCFIGLGFQWSDFV